MIVTHCMYIRIYLIHTHKWCMLVWKTGRASQFGKWLDERIYLKMFIYLSLYDSDTLYIYYISFNTNSQMVQASLKNGQFSQFVKWLDERIY